MRMVLLLVLSQLLAHGTAKAQTKPDDLVIRVENIISSDGTIMVALYDSEKNYLKKAHLGKSIAAAKGNLFIIFSDLKPGEYAVSAVHDANGNGELDKNFIGIPTEGFGFLNGVMGRFGPPKFEATLIQWTGSAQEVVIPLKYY